MAVTDHEQLMIELVNRARLDPVGEAKRLGFSNAEIADMNLPTVLLDPLAGIAELAQSADAHSAWMLSSDTFSHTGEGGSSAGDRMEQAGYVFSGSWSWGENIGYRGSSGNIDVTSAIYKLHYGLFDSDGHRANILNPVFAEIGIGAKNGDYLGYDAVMVTQNFATTANRTFLTGVVYDDADNDDFYSVGEGVGGVRFTVDGQSIKSQSAGGYALEFGGQGWHSVAISGNGTSAQLSVKFEGGNVKLDLVDGDTIRSSASTTLTSGVANAELLGLDDLTLTGHSGANELTGNAGDNALSGLAGDDHLIGGEGDDTLTGGTGDDVLEGGRGDDVYNGQGGTDRAVIDATSGEISVTELSDGWIQIISEDGIDRFLGVESFEFRDATLTRDDLLEPSSTAVGSSEGFKWTGSDESELVSGSAGDDTLKGHGGNDEITAGSGDDHLWGGGGKDTIKGNSGDDEIYAGHGDDRVVGQAGRDMIEGGDGADNLKGGGDADQLYGGADDDFLKGGSANDKVRGSTGQDMVLGNNGHDDLEGGRGNDTLKGGSGDDRLVGGRGNDFLKGGEGADEFVFTQGDGKDEIVDFDKAQDVLVLEAELVGPHTTGKAVLNNFATISDGNVVLDFGNGDVITLSGLGSLSGLSDNIEII